MLTLLRWFLDVWKFCGPLVYAVLETVIMVVVVLVVVVMMMKLRTKGFCNEIPLCEVAELCGFYADR
jgi:hypothetical protein